MHTFTWVVKEVGDLFVSSHLGITVKGVVYLGHWFRVVVIIRCLWKNNEIDDVTARANVTYSAG